jgi:hypothetical protein
MRGVARLRPQVDMNQGELPLMASPSRRVGLISCSSGKLDHRAPAAQLYTGQLFQLSKAWIVKRCPRWGILSAKHGLVLPEEEIDPYDQNLAGLTYAERCAWGARTREQIVRVWGRDALYTILAGADYCHAVDGLPYVEETIKGWTEQRRAMGMRKPGMGIGVIKQRIKQDLDRFGGGE